MKHSLLKVACVSLETVIANVDKNVEYILEKIEHIYENSAKLALFPELALTGYSCQTLFYSKAMFELVLKGITKIRKATHNKDILIVIGAPLVNKGRLYNCAVVLHKGSVLAVIPKKYVESADYLTDKYFAAGQEKITEINIDGEIVPFGTNMILQHTTIDNFSVAFEVGNDFTAPLSLSAVHSLAGANIVCNPTSLTEQVGTSLERKEDIVSHSKRTKLAYLQASCGCGESTAEYVYSGYKAIAECGCLLSQGDYKTDIIYAHLDLEALGNIRLKMLRNSNLAVENNYLTIPFTMDFEEKTDKCTRYLDTKPFLQGLDAKVASEEAFKLQQRSLIKRMQASGAKSMVLGLSGGLDSTLAILVANSVAKEYGWKLYAFSIPCFGTGDRTKGNSAKLAELLDVEFEEVDISVLAQKEMDLMHHDIVGDVAYENLQARQRTAFLFNMANKLGGLVVGTGDLSEIALGFCTYGGDHLSMYNVNASIPKTLAREIVNMYAEQMGGEINTVLQDILQTPISPELLPVSVNKDMVQSTEDIVGKYNLIDYILYYHVQYQFSKEKLKFMLSNAFAEYSLQEVDKALDNYFNRFYKNQFKRSCAPDGAQITAVSLSAKTGWMMSSDL